MNREAAKLIRLLAEASGKSEKALKREYYSFSDKGRNKMKQDIRRFLDENKGASDDA